MAGSSQTSNFSTLTVAVRITGVDVEEEVGVAGVGFQVQAVQVSCGRMVAVGGLILGASDDLERSALALVAGTG